MSEKQVKFIISGLVGRNYGIDGNMEVEKGQIFPIRTPADKKYADIWVADDIAKYCDVEEAHEPALERKDTELSIEDALLKLDVENDDHWTKAGRPSVDAVQDLINDDELKRGDIDDVDPDFDREKALDIATQSD
ncbi:MAG: hypothetical protein ACUZ8E_17505 [Candidatus Anammoxibacter sp.]